MTKKVISIILAVVMLVSMTTVTAFATTEESVEKEYLFSDKFAEKYYPPYQYDELYYHYDENDEIDWAIVNAQFNAGDAALIKCTIFERVLVSYMIVFFPYEWALYDVEANDFISIEEVDVTKYDGLEEGLAEAKVGYPFGDADLDGELNVLDATYIQRAVAKLCEFKLGDDLHGMWVFQDYDRPLDYISDIDGDGERTVLDATAIQKKLADIEDSTVAE